MTTNKKHEKHPEIQIEEAIGRTEMFIQKNGKILTWILIIIVILALAVFGYIHLYKNPRQVKASAAAFTAEQYFAQDSLELALNGDGANDGFLDVIDQYGSTHTGNMAKHYAGICYLKLGDYDSALEYLKQYRKIDGKAAEVINAQNAGLIGDIYAQQKDYAKAASQYAAAVKAGDNSLTAPMYLKKEGLAQEALGNYGKALECYEKIKNTYFNSLEARDIEKYIARAKQLQ